MNPQAKQNLEQIESEPLRQLLSQLLEGQNQIQEQLSQIDQEVRAWGGWLRTASGAVLFVVSISFPGAFFGLLLPIALELWRGRV